MYQGNYDGGATKVAERTESVVEREISQLGKATSELVTLAEDLQNRLSSVLRLEPEPSDKVSGVPIGPLTALPSAIREKSDSVHRAIYILRSILERLEL